MKKLVKRFLRNGQLFYESRVASWIAKHASWIYWPIFSLCKDLNICFVVNIAGGTGHIICELDYFFRKKQNGEIDLAKRYVWLRKADIYSKACVELYGAQFWAAKCSYLLYDLLLPLTMAYKELTLDCGLSRLKWQLSPNNEYFRPLPNQTYLYQLSKKEGLILWHKYYALRKKAPDFFPLTSGKFSENDLSFLNLKGKDKLALIHIKVDSKNATAQATNPNSYLPALELLISKGYRLVFVGREMMPREFKRLNIYNYSESTFANFRNDIQLFNKADLMIVGGSGIAFLADCYGKPYLYLNSWHIPMAMFSSKCISVPTLVQKKTGEFLKFKEQMELYDSLEDKGEEIFPFGAYTPRNASAEEIKDATEELLSCQQQDPSYLQLRYRNLKLDAPLHYVQSRCSEHFLRKYESLLS